MTTKKKKSPVLERVEEELKASADAGMLEDEEFDPEQDSRARDLGLGLGPFSRKSPAEIAVDRLLVGLKPGQGWYMKLSKETTPNDFQFKKRIDNFFNWTDLEFQINSIVRAETEAEYKRTGRVMRWGSGRYQIVFWNDAGIRGEARAPHIIDVDAQEDMFVSPGMNNTLAEGRSTADIIRALHEATNPMGQTEQMANMLAKGMEIAVGKEAKAENQANSMGMMMMQMMQQQQAAAAENTKFMIGILAPLIQSLAGNRAPGVPVQDPTNVLEKTISMLNTMGILGNNQKQDTFLQNISTMQTLGLIKPSSNEDEMTTLTKIKTFMGFAKEFAGAEPGQRPSIMEKLVDAVGPKVGEIASSTLKLLTLQQEARMRTPEQTSSVPSFPGMGPITPRRELSARTYGEYEPAQPEPVQQDIFAPNSVLDSQGFPDMNVAMNSDPFSGANMPADMGMTSRPNQSQQSQSKQQDMRIDTGQDTFQTHGEPMNQPAQYEVQSQPQPQSQPNAPTTGGKTPDMLRISKWARELKTFVYNRDISKFGYITQTLGEFFGGSEGVKRHAMQGTITQQDLIRYILMFDKDSYNKPETLDALNKYVDAYVAHLKTPQDESIGVCDTCHSEHVFDNEQHYKDEANENGGHVNCGIGGCPGTVTLKQLVGNA